MTKLQAAQFCIWYNDEFLSAVLGIGYHPNAEELTDLFRNKTRDADGMMKLVDWYLINIDEQ